MVAIHHAVMSHAREDAAGCKDAMQQLLKQAYSVFLLRRLPVNFPSPCPRRYAVGTALFARKF